LFLKHTSTRLVGDRFFAIFVAVTIRTFLRPSGYLLPAQR
jgi:hypothetical protein